jgi:hypothetical protein
MILKAATDLSQKHLYAANQCLSTLSNTETFDARSNGQPHPLRTRMEPLRSLSIRPPIEFGIFTRADKLLTQNPVTGNPTGWPALDETTIVCTSC